MARHPLTPWQPARGFTLIEVMVALAIMALLALLAWRGLDAMARARQTSAAYSGRLLALQTALAQWRTDLDATLPDAPALPAGTSMDWNGRTLRLLRLAPAESSTAGGPAAPVTPPAAGASAPLAIPPGLVVVAWTQRDGCPGLPDATEAEGPCWMRWQSPVLRTLGEQQGAWQQAAQWAGQGQANAPDNGMQQRLLPLERWQIRVYQNDNWQAPTPATGTGTDTRATLPDGVRVELTLPAQAVLSGTLTADWIQPTLTRSRQ